MANGSLTWLGHSAFRLDTPGGKRVYVDPFLENPKCPPGEKEPQRVDLIALTHGHDDHVGSTVELFEKHQPTVVAQVEVRWWLESKGVTGAAGNDPNKGGTWQWEGIEVSITDANHSSSGPEGQYLGEPTGLVFRLEDGKTVYFAGDTNVFGDMELIRRIYEPEIAVLPIGDHYTMGPREAAVALELLGVKRCVPSHFGTFPLLRGTPQQLQELAPGVEVHMIEPGDTVTL